MDFGDVRRLMPFNEVQNTWCCSHERLCHFWVGPMADDHQQCHTALHDGCQFVRLVADAPIVREGNPPAPPYLPQTLFNGSIVPNVVHRVLNAQSGGTQALRKFLAEVSVREKDRPRIHAARS
jgi:hypothetical protein